MATAIGSIQWTTTQQACLSLGISRSTLQKLKAAGHFQPGRCFYRRGLGRTASCAWDVEECRAVLQKLSAADPATLEVYSIANGVVQP
jgi:hypothetical protein